MNRLSKIVLFAVFAGFISPGFRPEQNNPQRPGGKIPVSFRKTVLRRAGPSYPSWLAAMSRLQRVRSQSETYITLNPASSKSLAAGPTKYFEIPCAVISRRQRLHLGRGRPALLRLQAPTTLVSVSDPHCLRLARIYFTATSSCISAREMVSMDANGGGALD